jgi:hypothetical protein
MGSRKPLNQYEKIRILIATKKLEMSQLIEKKGGEFSNRKLGHVFLRIVSNRPKPYKSGPGQDPDELHWDCVPMSCIGKDSAPERTNAGQDHVIT